MYLNVNIDPVLITKPSPALVQHPHSPYILSSYCAFLSLSVIPHSIMFKSQCLLWRPSPLLELATATQDWWAWGVGLGSSSGLNGHTWARCVSGFKLPAPGVGGLCPPELTVLLKRTCLCFTRYNTHAAHTHPCMLTHWHSITWADMFVVCWFKPYVL